MIRTTTVALFICALFAGTKTYSQARTGIALGYTLNKPFLSDYHTGGGISVIGNIAITKKWIIAPEVAYDNLAGIPSDILTPMVSLQDPYKISTFFILVFAPGTSLPPCFLRKPGLYFMWVVAMKILLLPA